ncbi:deoxyribodipyrimidine photo-lyase [Sulfurimonas sp.]|uniref:cryptochrome/photolyase family protein n=1 Tax=Sulfurimonas sp. TaxID=2022749 RepID=UPI0025D3CFDD|nr:deoxyribodipyrimidine photo-lyase [Sulfurimonas sp.]MBT5934885.1 deoxyribodipyrimidine photo-lyase [Sulfurimonas sp.]
MRRILWFRRDLRVKDNPLLSLGGEVLPIFIFDTNILSSLEKNDKRVSFIFFYVQKLKQQLKELGLDLKVFYGKPLDVFEYLIEKDFDEVVASGDYDAYAKQRDLEISHKIHFRYIQDTYIFKHKEVLKDNGSTYLVFTPFYKKARKILDSKNIKELPLQKHTLVDEEYERIMHIDEKLELLSSSFELHSIGFEEVALTIIDPYEKLRTFTTNINSYKEKRDFLESDVGSNLSVDLRFGTMSIREILRVLFENSHLDIEPFIRQLIFRDFYAYLLFHFSPIENENYKYSFNGIENKPMFKTFCEAKTGFPIVDAGVRELLKTGSMHNRVRMVVASFFTKDLLLPWQWGEAFFAKHLLDYDKASNVLSWQWSAGTGVDSQPYFRVFNPYLQSKKFDKDGVYIKYYVEELRNIEAKYLHKEEYLLEQNILNYPKPMVNHKEAAKKAIEIFKAQKV